MSFINKKTLSIIISVLSIIGYGYFAFAVAPTGGYSPAQTLDPACAPGDTDCFVQESWKIDTGNNFVYNTTSNIGIGTNTPRRQLDVSGDFEQVNGNASIRSYADPLADMSMFAGYFEGVANAYTFSPGNTSLSMVGDWDGEQVSFFGNVLNDNYFNGIMANGTDVDIMSQDPLSGSATAIGLRNSSINSSIQLTSPFGNVRVNSPEGLVLEPKTTAERAAAAGDGTIRFNSDLACLELYNSGWGCLGGGSGWALTGNAGTDGEVMNFIGTTDAEDFVVKTNGNQIAWFGQNRGPDGKWMSAGCFKQGFFVNEANLQKWLEARPAMTGRQITVAQALADKMKLTTEQIAKACKLGECK